MLPSHTHENIYTHTHTHIQAHSHSRTRSHTHTLTFTLSLTHTHTISWSGMKHNWWCFFSSSFVHLLFKLRSKELSHYYSGKCTARPGLSTLSLLTSGLRSSGPSGNCRALDLQLINVTMNIYCDVTHTIDNSFNWQFFTIDNNENNNSISNNNNNNFNFYRLTVTVYPKK